MILFFFCFKQKTAYEMRISDWSSDVCSSDLPSFQRPEPRGGSDAGKKIKGRKRRGVALPRLDPAHHPQTRKLIKSSPMILNSDSTKTSLRERDRACIYDHPVFRNRSVRPSSQDLTSAFLSLLFISSALFFFLTIFFLLLLSY